MSSPENHPARSGPEKDSATKDAPVPIWLIVLLFLLGIWGAIYFDEHGGGFDSQIYSPYVSTDQLKEFQVASGPNPFEQGRAIYNRTCTACHGPNALGSPGAVPPLADSNWVNEKEPGRMIRIVLRGFQGQGLVVNGKPFDTGNIMSAFGTPPPAGLTDEEIADVITFVRGNTEWGNHASTVTPEQVKAIRAKIADHPQSFSPAEMGAINPAD